MRFSRCRWAVDNRSLHPDGPARSRPRVGFTLLEVVVGLALMASVLVGAILSFSAHQKQLRHADATLLAVGICDDLLAHFRGSRDGIPEAGAGSVPGQPNWFWRTRVIGMTAPATIPLRVIRMDIIEITADGSRRVVSSVDVVESASSAEPSS